jgi:hypothetical protein
MNKEARGSISHCRLWNLVYNDLNHKAAAQPNVRWIGLR